MKKLLVIEDDPTIVRLLEIVFSNEYDVVSTAIGRETLSLIQKYDPLLVMLDIELPDMNGIELIEVIRAHSEVPIIMITGKNSDLEKVTSFNSGADDYVVKPFSVAELEVRVQAAIRKSRQASIIKRTVVINNKKFLITFEEDEHRFCVNNEELLLTNKEFMLLKLLFERNGKVLPRELILDIVWGINNLEIGTRAVDACISRLRKKIKHKIGDDIIETITSIGYRMTL